MDVPQSASASTAPGVRILAAMAINAVLFYLQMWKPMEEEEEVQQRKSAEEVVEMVEIVEVEEMVEVVEKVEIMEEEEEMTVRRNADDNFLKETKVRESHLYMILEREGGQRPF